MAGPFYIALEGSEGCGKSTRAQRLGEAIGAVITRETGGTPIGERLRAILHDTTVLELDDRAETLIVAADRAQQRCGLSAILASQGNFAVGSRGSGRGDWRERLGDSVRL